MKAKKAKANAEEKHRRALERARKARRAKSKAKKKKRRIPTHINTSIENIMGMVTLDVIKAGSASTTTTTAGKTGAQ